MKDGEHHGSAPSDARARIARRHMSFGWYALLAFSAFGVALESLHAFKVGFYLDVGSETRRSLWRLAHAHGTLLSLVHLAFAFTLPHAGRAAGRRLELASACLASATLLLPLGFFLGGSFAQGADPGIGVLLVPVGAVLLLIAAGTTARSLR